MCDPDVIVYLFPAKLGRDKASEVIMSPINRPRLIPPPRRHNLISPTPEIRNRFVREATEPPDDVNDLETLPCLALRFSDRPKSRLGVVAERDPSADLIMPNCKGVSGFHFVLTFDDQKELVVKDLGSLVGTRVIYDGEEAQRGHGIVWSARGPGLVKDRWPVLKVVEDLQFTLVVPDHDITSCYEPKPVGYGTVDNHGLKR